MDKAVFQDRAFFYSKKTTSLNAAGVPVVISYLEINQVIFIRDYYNTLIILFSNFIEPDALDKNDFFVLNFRLN